MKASSREDVQVDWYTDGKFQGTRIEKNRCIYKRKDGTEYITGFGDVTRNAATGRLFVERRCITVQPLNINAWIKKVKETGGSIVILPP